ncbi:MAG: pitrilysin family protein [Planctomycetota bacterium]
MTASPVTPAVAFTLANGLRFIVAEDHSLPVASAGLFVSAGVCDEPPARRGIAHYFEHMMFRGSANYGPKEHTRRITRAGGDCNAMTDWDATIFHETVPAAVLEEVFALEADRFMRPALAAAPAETEKQVVLEELRLYENQPMSRAFRVIFRELGGGHPYALDPLGREEDLRAVTCDDLAAFHRRLYRPGNVFGVVCGDVTVDRVRALAQAHFGGWADPPAAPAVGPARFAVPVGTLSRKVSVEVPLAIRLHRLPPAAELDHTALGLLAALLADGDSAPVQEMLVQTKRLCVQAGANVWKMRHGGILMFFGAFLPPGRHAPRHAALREVCDRFADKGPAEADFTRALRRFRKGQARARYDVADIMFGLGQAELLEGGFVRYEQMLADLAAVTPGRVRDLARTLFAPVNTLELDIHPEHQAWWIPLAGLFMKVRG